MPLLRVDRTVRNLKRYRQIATVLAKYGFGHIVDRLDLRTRLRLRRKAWRRCGETGRVRGLCWRRALLSGSDEV